MSGFGAWKGPALHENNPVMSYGVDVCDDLVVGDKAAAPVRMVLDPYSEVTYLL